MNRQSHRPEPVTGEHRLAATLAEELTAYRELYVLIDQQQEWLNTDSGIDICDLFSRIAAAQTRIQQSEEILESLRGESPELFKRWLSAPRIAADLKRIEDVIGKARDAVITCARIAEEKKRKYRDELNRIGVGRLMLAGMAAGEKQNVPHFIDERP